MADALSAPFGAGASNPREGAANPRQALSTRLARLRLEDIGRVLGKDDTEACKVRSGDRRCSLVEWCAIIDLAGLKLVDKSRLCVKPDEFNFMRNMTARALANEQMARELTFEDAE